MEATNRQLTEILDFKTESKLEPLEKIRQKLNYFTMVILPLY